MATYTEGYNLKKPDDSDFVNISDINGNMDIVDEALDNKANFTYCTCSTASSVLEKNAVVEAGKFELTAGVAVDVKFMYPHTNGTPKLNVNNTGAKPIKMYGNVAPEFNMWRAESIVRFVYDGTNWMMQVAPATIGDYGITKLSNSVSSTSNTLAATPSAVKAAYDLANNAIPKTQKATHNGVASLDANGIVPKEQLPDMIEPKEVTTLPKVGEENKLYIKAVTGAEDYGHSYEKSLCVVKTKQETDTYTMWENEVGPAYVYTTVVRPKAGDMTYYGNSYPNPSTLSEYSKVASVSDDGRTLTLECGDTSTFLTERTITLTNYKDIPAMGYERIGEKPWRILYDYTADASNEASQLTVNQDIEGKGFTISEIELYFILKHPGGSSTEYADRFILTGNTDTTQFPLRYLFEYSPSNANAKLKGSYGSIRMNKNPLLSGWSGIAEYGTEMSTSNGYTEVKAAHTFADNVSSLNRFNLYGRNSSTSTTAKPFYTGTRFVVRGR